MRVDNINMLNDTMAIMDRGYYEVNGKRVNLKLSEKERKEIFVFLPKDVKRISDNKDFQHVHVMGRIEMCIRDRLNWARLPPLTCTGVLHSLYPCTKGCTLCTPARTN